MVPLTAFKVLRLFRVLKGDVPVACSHIVCEVLHATLLRCTATPAAVAQRVAEEATLVRTLVRTPVEQRTAAAAATALYCFGDVSVEWLAVQMCRFQLVLGKLPGWQPTTVSAASQQQPSPSPSLLPPIASVQLQPERCLAQDLISKGGCLHRKCGLQTTAKDLNEG